LLVVVLAGFGKTTLVAEWVKRVQQTQLPRRVR